MSVLAAPGVMNGIFMRADHGSIASATSLM